VTVEAEILDSPTTAASGGARARALLGRLETSREAPLIVLVLGALLIAALAATVTVRIGSFALDETLIKQSAVHYTSGLPGSLIHDLSARGTSRLYSLILAPLFALFDGDVAIRVARGVNTLLFASAAAPVYLLGARVTGRRSAAVAAALLSIATPWLILTTALYTENATFPLFMWTVLCIERAVAVPSPRRDLLALLLCALTTAARTQFAILFVAYWLCAAALPALRDRRPLRGAARPLLARWRRAYPFSAVVLAVGVVAVLYLAVTGHLHREVQRALGSYSEIQDRHRISTDMSTGLLVEVFALAVGIGIAPAIVAVAWYADVLRRPLRREWTFAFVAVAVVAVFAAATVYAQGGYLVDRTEERYYFYAAPLLWIGALAALGPARPSRRAVAVAGGGFALVAALTALVVPLTPDSNFLAPVLSGVNWLLGKAIASIGPAGLGTHDAMLAIATVVVAALLWAWRRGRTRVALVLVVPALAQTAFTVWGFEVARGSAVGSINRVGTGASFATDGWVDRALKGRSAVWLNNQLRADPAGADATQNTTLFWNDQIRGVATDPTLALPAVVPTLASLRTGDIAVDPRSGAVTPPAAARGAVVQLGAAPHLQLDGPSITGVPNGLELIEAGTRPRARWVTTGLAPDGWLPPGKPVDIAAPTIAPGHAVVVTLSLMTPGGTHAQAHVTLGRARRTADLPPSAAAQSVPVRVRACAGPQGGVRGRLVGTGGGSVSGRRLAVELVAVQVEPLAGRCR
jgi:hypothetical protein